MPNYEQLYLMSGLSQIQFASLRRFIENEIQKPENRIGLEGPAPGQIGDAWNNWLESFIVKDVINRFWGPGTEREWTPLVDRVEIWDFIRTIVIKIACELRSIRSRRSFQQRFQVSYSQPDNSKNIVEDAPKGNQKQHLKDNTVPRRPGTPMEVNIDPVGKDSTGIKHKTWYASIRLTGQQLPEPAIEITIPTTHGSSGKASIDIKDPSSLSCKQLESAAHSSSYRDLAKLAPSDLLNTHVDDGIKTMFEPGSHEEPFKPAPKPHITRANDNLPADIENTPPNLSTSPNSRQQPRRIPTTTTFDPREEMPISKDQGVRRNQKRKQCSSGVKQPKHKRRNGPTIIDTPDSRSPSPCLPETPSCKEQPKLPLDATVANISDKTLPTNVKNQSPVLLASDIQQQQPDFVLETAIAGSKKMGIIHGVIFPSFGSFISQFRKKHKLSPEKDI